MTKALVQIVKGLVTSKGIKLGSRFLGRSVGVIGVGISGWSSVKVFRTYLKDDPHNQRLAALQEEIGKWSDAISCLGRDPYNIGELCNIHDGGAINALGYKELVRIPNTRYPLPEEGFNFEYHLKPDEARGAKKSMYVEPNPTEAITLIERSIEYVGKTEDIKRVKDYQTRSNDALDELVGVRKEIILPYERGTDYGKIQQRISATVRKMLAIEQDYLAIFSKLEWERWGRRAKYAGIAASSAVIGLVSNKIPGKRKGA